MKPPSKDSAVLGRGEIFGIGILGLMVAWFLHVSWRKWPDPIIDSGPQWYDTWQVSLGAMPYHDFTWYYGPLSILFNGLLFKCFGPGMMVLAAANLVIYAGIVTLAYLAFRMAWGKLAAFAALAVFISVFSFSMLNGVGNYNYVLPYANETTHGMLLLLVTAFVMVRWTGHPSRLGAFALGLCGGLAAVLKPEFMLAAGVLGLAALVLRYGQRQPVRLGEYGMLLVGLALPTLGFAAWFARRESWSFAMIDASQAWGLVLNQKGPTFASEAAYLGFENGWRNLRMELAFALSAFLVIGAIWAAGWVLNRPWSRSLRCVVALGACLLACSVDVGGGFKIGPCLPGLILIIFGIVAVGLGRELREKGRASPRVLMALALVLLAGSMLARMALRARVDHFGFIQAALAGMVVAAFLVAEVPRWTGGSRWGRRVALFGTAALLILTTTAIAAESTRIHADQTQPVGSGVDFFYAFAQDVDETGLVVNWAAERMRSIPPDATLLVLPEGVMINYLSRHRRPMAEFSDNETNYVSQLASVRPDYVIWIWGDRREGGFPKFGDPGQPGEKIRQWLGENYDRLDVHRGRSKWAFVFKRKGSN